MDLLRTELARVEHRHGASWHEMHDVTPEHDPAEGDVERTWARARILRCATCEEEVRVVGRADGTPR
ncbi:MAG: hypothetical protein M3N29_07610 [Chloroflexota bacterium]|nr:hypothetical protein [Chloroflexota bacterium]